MLEGLGELALKVGYIELNKSNQWLYVRTAVLSSNIMKRLISHMDPRVTKRIHKDILLKLPPKMYRYVLLELVETSLEVSLQQSVHFNEPIEILLLEMKKVIEEFNAPTSLNL